MNPTDATADVNDALADHLIRETERMEDELLQARAVQRYLLPPDLQNHPTFRAAFVYHPLHHVGGDFIDTLLRPDGHFVIMIGDVSGHGVAAALSSAMLKAAFLRHASTASGPGNLLTLIDRELGGTIRFGRFVTALVVWFNIATREVTLTAAGHPSPLLMRQGQIEDLPFEPQLPLFTGEAVQYPDAFKATLQPGDRMLLMTDGVLEAVRTSGDLLSTDDLLHIVRSCSLNGNFAECLFESLLFSDLVFNDDVTLFTLEVV